MLPHHVQGRPSWPDSTYPRIDHSTRILVVHRLLSYTSCNPTAGQICVSTFFFEFCLSVCRYVPFIRWAFGHHCWLRNAFQIASSTVLAYRCGSLFTVAHTGYFFSVILHYFRKNHTCELHDLTTPRPHAQARCLRPLWYRLLMESRRLGSTMAASVRYMVARAAEESFNKTIMGTNHTANHFTQSEANKTISSSASQAIIDKLVFQNSKSVRTSTIILAAFNILAALATAVSILYDCYWTSKRCAPKYTST